MSRGGHNWKGRGTVEGARSLDVRILSRAGLLSGPSRGDCHWGPQDGTTGFVSITGERNSVTLDYQVRCGTVVCVSPLLPACL